MLYAIRGLMDNCLLPFSARNLFGNNLGTSRFAISSILHRYCNGAAQNRLESCFMFFVVWWIIVYFFFLPEVFLVTA